MSIIAKSDTNSENEYLRFLSTLKQALLLLDTLGQIQSIVGGLSMSSRAGVTFEIEAMLKTYIEQIEYNSKRK